MQNGQGAPHLLHDLQDLDAVVLTGGHEVAICGLKAIVVVVVVFVKGNGAHENVGLFALEGAKHPMSSFSRLASLLGSFFGFLWGQFFWCIGLKLGKRATLISLLFYKCLYFPVK